MLNKKIFSIIAILCLPISIVAVSALEKSTPSSIQTSSNEYSNDSNVVKSTEASKMTYIINGNRIELNYSREQEINNLYSLLPEGKLYKKHFDCYIDNENTEYFFTKGTTKLCGIQSNKCYEIYTPQEKAISIETAKSIANTYLTNLVSQFNEYVFSSYIYDEALAVYQIQYAFYLCGIPTDDTITVFVTATGQVSAYSAFNHGDYQKYKDTLSKSPIMEKARSSDNLNASYAITFNGAEPCLVCVNGNLNDLYSTTAKYTIQKLK